MPNGAAAEQVPLLLEPLHRLFQADVFIRKTYNQHASLAQFGGQAGSGAGGGGAKGVCWCGNYRAHVANTAVITYPNG